ncbi:DUF2637 domain-containing protein [Plantactinospora solaniradicis]|uniref:DUF2637 domain-containing protein n=1 Tax=Plantactinospora solaniradicis TaxID=1723736 RepID=A0ABW1K7F6_9ACTN
MTPRQLKRIRWAVRAVLLLGVAVSITGNVLHARDNPISQAIAAWPPLALLLTVELISRVPVHRRSLAFTRWVATATLAGIAAWISYWHMVGVAARYGETDASPYLLPLSVDGLVVVASICLVELGGRLRDAATSAGTAQPAAAAEPVTAPTPEPDPPAEPPTPDVEETDAPEEPVTAGQRVRRDERAADDVAATIRALRVANPDWSARRIGVAVGRSEATVRRALGPADVAPVSGPPATETASPLPAMAGATQGGEG